MTCFDLWNERRHTISHMPQPNRGLNILVWFDLISCTHFCLPSAMRRESPPSSWKERHIEQTGTWSRAWNKTTRTDYKPVNEKLMFGFVGHWDSVLFITQYIAAKVNTQCYFSPLLLFPFSLSLTSKHPDSLGGNRREKLE